MESATVLTAPSTDGLSNILLFVRTQIFQKKNKTILMKYHALFVIFEKAAKFEFVVCCRLQVALYGLKLVSLPSTADFTVESQRLKQTADTSFHQLF